MSINLISSKDSDEIRNIYTKSNNIETMMGSEADDIIDELFKSLLQRYQDSPERLQNKKQQYIQKIMTSIAFNTL